MLKSIKSKITVLTFAILCILAIAITGVASLSFYNDKEMTIAAGGLSISSLAENLNKEITKLAWSMVCNSDGVIADAINLSNNASKGRYSGRIIPLHKELKILLADLLAERQKDEYFSLDKPIIATERGEHTTPQVIVNFFYTLYKTIGFNGCSSHSGRRTFITNAAKHISLVGGTLNDVRLLAGHSSLATTQRYIAYDTEAQRKIVEMS